MSMGNRAWIALVGLIATSAATAADIYVGIVEDYIPFERKNDPEYRAMHVRLAFIKDQSGWSAINNARFPVGKMTWHVAFDGRELGTIEAQPPEGGIVRDGDLRNTLSIVTPVQEIPRVKRDKRRIPTYIGVLQSQPLVAVSAPLTRDPDRWKRTQLSKRERGMVLGEFRKLVPKMRLCDEPENQIGLVEYPDKEVEVQSYRAKDGRVIAGAQIPDKTGCGMYEDEAFYSYWYVLETDGSMRLFGDEMTPIDAADLDGDGESEWIFKGYKGCATGYRMYTGNFRNEINNW
jgi:hypothetical protein